ncbi:MAG: hypothetical protein M3Y18_00045 [Candidatus Eremiobacteraeota bacterium]|nr:hypothetical protein [Candidatus Eremiobacteraeota bacterium]
MEDDRWRLAVAFAIAIALHEVFAGFFPDHYSHVNDQREVVQNVEIMRIHKKPKPTPKPIVRKHVIAQTHVQPKIVSPAANSQPQHIARKAQARPLVRTRYHLRVNPVHLVFGGQGTSSGHAKALTGGAGTGGSGSGTGGSGNGIGGAPAASEPCGYVELIPAGGESTDPQGRVTQTISVSVHFPDQTNESVPLDYPFIYPTTEANPFRQGSTLPATFQFPPANLRYNEPSLVQYVMRHTTADGYTRLKKCPYDSGN